LYRARQRKYLYLLDFFVLSVVKLQGSFFVGLVKINLLVSSVTTLLNVTLGEQGQKTLGVQMGSPVVIHFAEKGGGTYGISKGINFKMRLPVF